MMGVRCGGCGAGLRFAGEACYACSPRGWIADIRRRHHGGSQNGEYAVAFGAALLAGERRMLDRARGRQVLADARLDSEISRFQRDRREGLALIERLSAGAASRRPFEIARTVEVDDIRVLRRGQGGDGRTVEAYAAVFNEPAEIHDHQGDYEEEIDPHAWDDRLAEARRARGGLPAEIKVMFNHSMTRQGTPSDRWSLPIGKPLDIRPDSRGLLTVTHYSDDQVLDRIKAGELTSQSFTGAIIRSTPELRRGDRYRPDSTGSLRTVRRMKLGLREYGPVLWPAYPGAEILGVRSAEALRPAAEAAARAPGAGTCSGPDCPICAYGRLRALQ